MSDILDGRVRDPKKRGLKTSKIGQLTPAFCVMCHKQDGWVTEEGTGLIIGICDDCMITCGPPPGLQAATDEQVAKFCRTGKHN